MRFRKSIQLVKGVRINFSKSGISATLGGRGMSVNIGSRGTYLNTGIPGTGLYDRTKLSGRSPSSSQTEGGRPLPMGNISVSVEDDGRVEIRDPNGILITDESLLRRIKRTNEFKALKIQLMEQLKEGIERETSNIIDIYKMSAEVVPLAEYEAFLASFKPNRYDRIPFDELPPNEDNIRAQLAVEAKQKIRTMAFWRIKRLREEYIEQELPGRYIDLYSGWQSRALDHEQAQAKIEESTNAEYYQEYMEIKKALEYAIQGQPEYIEQEIGRWISSVELPVEFNIQFECDREASRIMLDLDLPEIESMPTEKAVQLASGQVKRKPKTQKEVKYDYMCCVYGLAVFFASHVFVVSPVINEIVVSGYTQRRNKKTGDIQDEYVYSTKFIRSFFEQIDFESIDLCNFWEQFENRCLPTQTYELKKIVPF